MELGGLGQFPGPQYLPFSNQEGGLNSTKACLSVIGGQQGWGGECGEVGEGSSSLSIWAAAVCWESVPEAPISLAGALWLRNTECKTEEMTRESLPSIPGLNFSSRTHP